MRMRILKLLGTAAQWIDRILAVHLRMDIVSGVRTR
jgi:hypothetical protein